MISHIAIHYSQQLTKIHSQCLESIDIVSQFIWKISSFGEIVLWISEDDLVTKYSKLFTLPLSSLMFSLFLPTTILVKIYETNFSVSVK